MGNANAGGWRYTARYGWNWRSARAISGALGSLALCGARRESSAIRPPPCVVAILPPC